MRDAARPAGGSTATSCCRRLVELQYERNDAAFHRGTFRVRGDTVEIFPGHYEDRAWRVALFGDEVEAIPEFDPLTGEKHGRARRRSRLYANSHYVTPRPTLQQAISDIKVELKQRLRSSTAEGKLLEAQRLEQRTTFDIEMMETTGSCKGIENYSRYLTGREARRAAADAVRVPAGERAADRRREPRRRCRRSAACTAATSSASAILAEFGFRLPSCARQPAAEVRGVGA